MKKNSEIGIFDPNGVNNNPLNDKPYSNEYKNLSQFWSKLPAYSEGHKIVKQIEKNDILLSIFGTGGGKTVLMPKFALHSVNYKGKIVITLPKKIITKKAAEFAAKTLDVELGEQVGYQFKGDNMKSQDTNLLYMTDGSLISLIKSNPTLDGIDIVIIDEAHERKIQIDILLLLLKIAIKKRKEKGSELKLIIMSATINAEIFLNYFNEFKIDKIELEGTPNYPIESIYIPNVNDNNWLEIGKKTILNIVSSINKKTIDDGDILFFVSTVSECESVVEELNKDIGSTNFIMALYSGMDKSLDDYISSNEKYKELNPKYERRIFIATNVAESSLTIDGIGYVVDSGLELTIKFDAKKNVNVLLKDKITRAQMTQRMGRAGRTRKGVCYHLYKDNEIVKQYPDPEIRCVDLKNVCLTLMKMGNGITGKQFTIENIPEIFDMMLEPPNKYFINNGIDFLKNNKLVNSNGMISVLGYICLDTRLDIQDALSLFYAFRTSSTIFKQVFQIICICVSIKSGIDDLFFKDINSKQKSKIIKNILDSMKVKSEHVLLLELYNNAIKEKDNTIYNIEICNEIKKLYNKQYDKFKQIFKNYEKRYNNFKDKNNENYKLFIDNKDLKKKTDSNSNIVLAFNYGYKDNIVKYKEKYTYNKLTVDTSKLYIKDDLKKQNFIYYTNVLIKDKLTVNIVSPYILK